MSWQEFLSFLVVHLSFTHSVQFLFHSSEDKYLSLVDALFLM